MKNALEPLISSETIAAYERDGAVLLRGVFAPWVAGVCEAIEQNKSSPSWRERTYRPDDGSAPFFQDYCVWSQFDGYRALVTESPMAKIAAQLMRSNTARIFHDHVLVKEPGNSVVTPWHQDRPYYLVQATQTVSFWVPLDPVPRERSIEYVGGSHRWGTDFKPTRFDGTDLYPGDSTEQMPNIEQQRNELPILGWAVEPGDAIAFDFGTIHGAPANASALRRRVTSIRWVGDDALFAKRLGKTSPAYPDLQYQDGAPFDAPEFPVIYNKRSMNP